MENEVHRVSASQHSVKQRGKSFCLLQRLSKNVYWVLSVCQALCVLAYNLGFLWNGDNHACLRELKIKWNKVCEDFAQHPKMIIYCSTVKHGRSLMYISNWLILKIQETLTSFWHGILNGESSDFISWRINSPDFPPSLSTVLTPCHVTHSNLALKGFWVLKICC